MKISYTVEVPIGHRLFGYRGKCANPHGHNYLIRVTIAGNPDPMGLVMDYKDLASRIDKALDFLDHAFVIKDGDPLEQVLLEHECKYVILSRNPSAENLASLILNQILDRGLNVDEVEVRETSDTSARALGVDRKVYVRRKSP